MYHIIQLCHNIRLLLSPQKLVLGCVTRAVRIQSSYIRPSLEWEVQESVLDLAQVVRGEVARVAVVHQEQPAERRRVGAGGGTLLVVDVLGVGNERNSYNLQG